MTSVYACNVVGTGTAADPYRASITGPHACLMIDPTKAKALVVSPSDTLSGTGISPLLTAASWPALVEAARTTNPTTAQRSALNNWLAGGGYTALPASAVSWWDCLHHAARQVNPAADLAATMVG